VHPRRHAGARASCLLAAARRITSPCLTRSSDANGARVIGRRLARCERSLFGACLPLGSSGHTYLAACWAEARIKLQG
jgi:hypothetical protein